ncbi:MAG: flagellar hook assembly protein FlgD [Gammaproteobacteria bacterium]|nr:flagellar hook assembly protein FlgD [Gammaproteobacteria bacterium]
MSAINTDANVFQSLGLAREQEQQPKQDQLQMENFLELMITELTHQDPFKPMENTELATQISQFATVSGIDQLNSSFSGLSGSLLSDQSLQAANLVGRDVLVPINGGYLEKGGLLQGVVGLEGSASNVTVSVHSAEGALVREIELGTQAAGEVGFSWDGKMDNDEYADPGRYRIEVQAMVGDEPVAPYLLTQSQVNSVSIGSAGQGLILNLNGMDSISFNDVAEIR